MVVHWSVCGVVVVRYMDAVVVSAWNAGGTRCSGIMSSAADVLEMSMVRGTRYICVWLWAAWEESG